jgi:hypothetical protein
MKIFDTALKKEMDNMGKESHGQVIKKVGIIPI